MVGRGGGGRGGHLTASAAGSLLAVAGRGAPRAGAHGAPPKLAQAGHVTFWECPAATTELLVAVNTLTLHPGAIARHHLRGPQQRADGLQLHRPLRGRRPGPTSTTLEAGPCGSVGYEIVGPHQRNVWPGDRVVNCPALGFAQLAPGGIVTGAGSWNQNRSNSAQRVPVGRYTLVVNRHFSFPIHIVAE